MGVLAWLLGSDRAEDARANCHGRRGVTAYQASLMPGDIGYLCNACGQSLLGGFMGLGHCRCSS
ncbi:MAG: hypothetical protein AB7W59_03290 [Acidimicrobiia bacterium]